MENFIIRKFLVGYSQDLSLPSQSVAYIAQENASRVIPENKLLVDTAFYDTRFYQDSEMHPPREKEVTAPLPFHYMNLHEIQQ